MMTIEENWERLNKFYQELDVDKAKNIYSENLGELEYSPKDIEEYIQKILSVDMKFQPATDENIIEMEEKLSVTLSQTFKESVKINAYDILSKGYSYNWLGGWNAMVNPKEMIEFSLGYKENLDFESFDDRIGLDGSYAYWGKEWVVIFQWNMDYLGVLNLAKESPHYGEVLCVEIEGGSIARWADSFESWFEMAVDEVMMYGELRLKTIEELLGIY